MEWTLEIVLVVLLLATLVQALRLERALGLLRRDRVALEALIAGFNTSTRQAEAGVERLQIAADTAGRKMDQQIAVSTTLKDDLLFLTERGDRVADRLDVLVRDARRLSPEPSRQTDGAPAERTAATMPSVRTEAEKSLLQALRLAR